MVFNNTKVIQARLIFRKEPAGGAGSQGALIEIFLIQPALPQDYQITFTQTKECSWFCLVGNLKRWRESSLPLSGTFQGAGLSVTLTARRAAGAAGQ